jgi:hypothetical protein
MCFQLLNKEGSSASRYRWLSVPSILLFFIVFLLQIVTEGNGKETLKEQTSDQSTIKIAACTHNALQKEIRKL